MPCVYIVYSTVLKNLVMLSLQLLKTPLSHLFTSHQSSVRALSSTLDSVSGVLIHPVPAPTAMQWVSVVHKHQVCEVTSSFVHVILCCTENIENLAEFQLRLIDLNGMIIQRPLNITNREFTSIGRLEVLYAGHWGTVCTDGFTDASREVACKQLGYIRCIHSS